MEHEATGSVNAGSGYEKPRGKAAAHAGRVKRPVISLAGPSHLYILSTSRCNLSCFMCYHQYVDDMNVLIEPEKLDPFLENARSVHLAGGEPFWITEKTNRAAGKILDHITSRYPDIKLSANTNGTLLNGKMAEFVVENFEWVNFSMDTLDARLYEKIRGKPLLGALLENLERLNELKIQKGLGRCDNPLINVHSLVMDSTLDGLPDITRRAGKLGVRFHSIAKLWDMVNAEFEHIGAKKRLLQLKNSSETGEILKAYEHAIAGQELKDDPSTKKRMEKARDGLIEAAASSGVDVVDRSGFLGITPRSVPLPNATESVCPEPWVSATIVQNGDVFTCCLNSVRLGNLREKSFDEIWNGPAARGLRESFLKGELKGCSKSVCDSPVDYFAIPESYLKSLEKNLGGVPDANGRVESILLLRTGPLHQSHLAARGLLRKFPDARLTVVTNPEGYGGKNFWGEKTELHVYPQEFLEPESFMNWWSGNGADVRYFVAAMIYGNAEGKGYEKVEEIMRSINAKNRIGIMPDGSTTRL